VKAGGLFHFHKTITYEQNNFTVNIGGDMTKRRFLYILVFIAVLVTAICALLLFGNGILKKEKHIGVRFVQQETIRRFIDA
jgi:hypothetical protein